MAGGGGVEVAGGGKKLGRGVVAIRLFIVYHLETAQGQVGSYFSWRSIIPVTVYSQRSC